MTEYELHSLIAEFVRDMDSMVEFWLSGTFAVIIARFVAGDALSRRTLWLMTVLSACDGSLIRSLGTSCFHVRLLCVASGLQGLRGLPRIWLYSRREADCRGVGDEASRSHLANRRMKNTHILTRPPLLNL